MNSLKKNKKMNCRKFLIKKNYPNNGNRAIYII